MKTYNHRNTPTHTHIYVRIFVRRHSIVIEMYKMLTAINYYKSGLPRQLGKSFQVLPVENNLRKLEYGKVFLEANRTVNAL